MQHSDASLIRAYMWPSSSLQCPTFFSSCLHPGAHFTGSQVSRCKKFVVDVTIQSVNLSEKTLCGLLKVEKHSKNSDAADDAANGKCAESYFEGEIISRQFPFITGKWDTNIETDVNHWNELNVMMRFPNYYKDSFDYSQLEDFDHVYMRWREKFIFDSLHVGGKPSAGFYYVCLQKSTGDLTGYFYSKGSERLQLLELKYEPRMTTSAFQIR